MIVFDEWTPACQLLSLRLRVDHEVRLAKPVVKTDAEAILKAKLQLLDNLRDELLLDIALTKLKLEE